jgi:hypothetical protein
MEGKKDHNFDLNHPNPTIMHGGGGGFNVWSKEVASDLFTWNYT